MDNTTTSEVIWAIESLFTEFKETTCLFTGITAVKKDVSKPPPILSASEMAIFNDILKNYPESQKTE